MPSHVFTRTDSIIDDPAKASKRTKPFNEAMSLATNPEPVHINPRTIAIDNHNRLPSARQVHNAILKSVFNDGHGPSRPVPGILCEVQDPTALKELVAHNEKVSKSPLMTPLGPSLLRYEILGGTHYTTTLR